MTPERYHRIGELFDVATGLAEAERDAYLNQACGDDDALRREVAELLKSDQSAADFLSPKAAVAATVESIGPYKIQRQLGEGGMGTVYLAGQSQPIQREVALKVIRAGMGSKAVIARFDGERRALALMDLPIRLAGCRCGRFAHARLGALQARLGCAMADPTSDFCFAARGITHLCT